MLRVLCLPSSRITTLFVRVDFLSHGVSLLIPLCLKTDMQVVPKPDALDAVGPVSMAKSIAFPSSIDLMGMLGGPLLFEKLVPYAIQEAIIEYQKRVSKTVKEIDTKTADAMSLGSK